MPRATAGRASTGADAEWRTSHGLPAQPRLAVLSRSLELSPQHPFFAKAVVRPLVVTCTGAPASRREELEEVADVIVAGEASVDLTMMRDALAEAGPAAGAVRGRTAVFGALRDAGLVDEVCITVAPRMVGGSAGRIMRGAREDDSILRLVHALADDEGYLLLRYSA